MWKKQSLFPMSEPVETDQVDLYSRAQQTTSKILISGAPNSTPSLEGAEIDEIDADAHETFTLEEMRKLILSYRKKDKDFLIARVTTPDPDDQSVFYNFYYSAAEINRILFKFESNRRLLHRMRVKNPLNNMYIVGQVFYYKLTVQDVDKAIVEYFFRTEKEQKKTRQAFSAIFSRSHQTSSQDTAENQRSKDCSDIRQEPARRNSREKAYWEVIESVKKGETPLPEDIPSEREVEYSAKFFATDDDFLVRSEVRDYFKKNALEETDDFLYEIDRPRNDFMALIDEDTEDVDTNVSDWRRIFSAHVSLALSMLFVCLLLGGGPGFAIIFLPLAVLIFLSFLCSLFYVLFCRRSSFDSLAVNSMDEEV